jgi:GntR family transcriptional repressor for pyruvate dehydrogenase complex
MAHAGGKQHKRVLVQETAAKLRDRVLASEPDTQIGSLTEIAQALGVGIVTVQQAARILEHEGLLAVRRGPGGGYYGKRPDADSLQRALAAYLRVHGLGYRDGLEMSLLLDCEIIPAAARCRDDALRRAMSGLLASVDACDTVDGRAALETQLRTLLHQMASHPLAEFLLRVTATFYHAEPASDRDDPVFSTAEAVAIWKTGKRRMMQAIADGDEERAQFEAERYRKQVLRLLRE